MDSDVDLMGRDDSAVSRVGRATRAVLGTTAAVAASVVIAVAATEGSLALWAQAVTVEAGSVQTGSPGLDIEAAFTAASWSNLLVGESVRQPFTITNTGDVPFELTASGTVQNAAFELRAVRGACPSTQLSGSSIVTTPADLGVLAAGATTTACLEVRLGAAATPGITSTVLVTIDGTQTQAALP